MAPGSSYFLFFLLYHNEPPPEGVIIQNSLNFYSNNIGDLEAYFQGIQGLMNIDLFWFPIKNFFLLAWMSVF
jgi:hypothetical protein